MFLTRRLTRLAHQLTELPCRDRCSNQLAVFSLSCDLIKGQLHIAAGNRPRGAPPAHSHSPGDGARRPRQRAAATSSAAYHRRCYHGAFWPGLVTRLPIFTGASP